MRDITDAVLASVTFLARTGAKVWYATLQRLTDASLLPYVRAAHRVFR
ncbi:TPA: hypothetical protein HH295_19380 [Xanthomonas vasicola pv. zeae]|nr:hypothetical protein [Xanthomonas vasicola]MBV6741671.1 hypothetical protein [Xanthomonas vasicola pv. musacearum NCPPB 2251]MBV6744706.1 hypothetical protein [Xanthomonas vasicola pv. vasculorum NCPPB 890]MBV6890319.1 hypothetical protein [Xanthomonas vasicola pv. vasculorum]MBV7277523.1 hypothetical protein [Xanthomonas vasicola pv. musacearum]MBV7289896.1 hypothetical protein [Xanthomonas vasicola pv. musacearum]